MLRAPVRGYAWALLATVALALAVALGPGTGEAQAQQAVCSNNPGPGERIECTEPATSTADIDIDVEDVAITTMDRDSIGIYGEHSGTGDVTIDVQGGTITTESTDIDPNFGETSSHGIYGHHIYGEHPDAAAVDIDVEDVDITTKGVKSHGIYGSHQDTGDVTIDVEGGTIMTESTGLNTSGVTFANGIYAGHQGTGVVDINVRGGTMITTMGVDSHGIYGSHLHNGAMDIDVENVDIKTMGVQSFGIFGEHGGSTGDIDIFLQGGSITTQGLVSHGIYALHQGLGAGGDIVINTRNHVITTESTDVDPDYLDTFSHGIYARHQSIGNITIDARGGGITTKGVFSYGLYALHEEDGDITIDTRDGHTIMTTGGGGHGIVAEQHQGTMDSRSIAITVGGTVNASGAAAQGVRVGRLDNGALDRVAAIGEDGYRQQTVTVNGSVMGDDAGVWLAGGGRVVIGPEGTIGAQSGIAILATGTVPEVPAPDPNPDSVAAIPAILPKLRVDLNLGGRPVAQAIGNNWIMNDGGETTIAVNGTVLHEGATGVTGRTAANGVWNVRMREEGVNVDYITDPNPANWEMIEPTAGVVADRDFSAQDFNEARRPSPPPPPPPMPMPQTVMVDEPVFGDADEEAGVHLPAGGRVLIGPAGTVGGESGIAILAEGDAPMLHVDLTLDGRRVAEVIGDDWIINDGGETTIVVNDVTLHDGATGVVEDAVAPNGGNVRVTQRSRRATGVVRDAMAANGAFNVTMRPEGVTVMDRSDPDPANWVITEPAAGVVVDRDFSAEDFIETSTQPMFDEEYAPRAALYEILPDFLLRLTGPGPGRRCGSTPDSSVWTRVAGGQGVYESDRSTTGATYDLERFEAEGGLSASLGARAKGWVSVRHVQGTAGVASPTGGGEIDVRGLGSTVGGSWRGANDVYAVGCFSYLAYDVDFASTRQGVLKAGVDGQAYTLDLEAGRRYAVGEQAQLTPRVWVMGSRVSVDDFTDAVGARMSLANADRVLVGLGVQADTTRPWAGGAFLLRGSVDIEQMVSGATTTTQVSGERLSAAATDTSLLFGLRGVYRHDRVTVGAELAARQELGSTDSEYTSFLHLGVSF